MDKDQAKSVEVTVEGTGGHGARTGAQVGAQLGAVVGALVDEVSARAVEAAGTLSEGYGTVRDRVAAADTGALVKQWGEALEGVIEDGRRAATRTPPPRRRPRWPWAAAATVAGAAAGIGVALAARRVVGHDSPDAQEPEQLLAVVDVPQPGPAGTDPLG